MRISPVPDPGLDPFRGGIAVLVRDGAVAGHLASWVRTFWSPGRLLSRDWWVWFIVVWVDGSREEFSDYPPLTQVREIQSGSFTWKRVDSHRGQYTVEWVTDDERESLQFQLGVRPEDF